MRVPLVCATAASLVALLGAQDSTESREIVVPGSTHRVLLGGSNEGPSVRYSTDSGRSWSESVPVEHRLRLRFADFDPSIGTPEIDARLQRPSTSRLNIVQLHAAPTAPMLRHVTSLGARFFQAIPDQSYVVRAGAEELQRLRASQLVRAITPMHIAYKLDERLIAAVLYARALPKQRYDVLLVDPVNDRAPLLGFVRELGGEIANANDGNILVDLELTKEQVLAVAARDEVLWMEPGSEPEEDMDIVRWWAEADLVEPLGGTGGKYTGKGVRGHIMEGIYPTHPEYTNSSIWRSQPWSVPIGNNTAAQGSSHGNSTFSISFAYGARPQARGLVPDGQGMYTNYSYVYNNSNRLSLNRELTDGNRQHKAMYQTASWGYSRTTQYTSRSAEMDRIIFDVDLPTCQSQSNAGATSQPRNSRPQAWAKNIISVGAVRHYGNQNPADDRWANGGSTGPASDGRIKPDLCGYYDGIYAASGSTSYTSGFGGTSGATPIVAGCLGLSLELWTDGLWGHPMQSGGWQARFENRPHFTTSKAMLINTAYQYDLSSQATRYQQGWGFPKLKQLYDTRDTMLVVNEQDVLQARESREYWVWVPVNTPVFRATMTYADVEGTVNVTTPHRVNDLDLRVHSSKGLVFHGNQGLTANHFSSSGGSRDSLNTVENVFVLNPTPGLWRIVVSAPVVLQDTHTETRVVDADFALVASGIGGMRDRSGFECVATKASNGDVDISLQRLPRGYQEGWVVLTFDQSRPAGHGAVLGMQWDAFSVQSLASPKLEGNPFHFAATSRQVFPNTPFSIPADIVALLKNARIGGLDATGLVLDANGRLIVSNVARVEF